MRLRRKTIKIITFTCLEGEDWHKNNYNTSIEQRTHGYEMMGMMMLRMTWIMQVVGCWPSSNEGKLSDLRLSRNHTEHAAGGGVNLGY